MANQTASLNAQVAARLGSAVRAAGTRILTVDNTVRRITLTAGGWRLYGHATQVYYAIREATDATGTLATGEAAPTTSELAAASAGSPGAGLAWPASGTAVTALRAPTDTSLFVEIAVRRGGFVNLYVRVASSTAAPVLEGPFESPLASTEV